MAGQAVISGQLTGVPTGQVNFGPFTLAGNSGNFLYVATYEFASGNTTVTIPNYTAYILITPDPSNTIFFTLKGVAGDTGFGISHNTPTLLGMPASVSPSFVIDAASSTTTQTTITFF